MKTALLTVGLFMGLSTTGFAQEPAPRPTRQATDKGGMFSGCDLLLASAQNSEFWNPGGGWYYNVGLKPRLAYFVKDDLAIGADLNLRLEGQTNTMYRVITTGLGLFGRYYFGKSTDKNGQWNRLRFFTEAGAGYSRLFNRYDINDNGVAMVGNQEFNAYSAHVMPGLAYFLAPNAAAQLGLNFQHFSQEETKVMSSYETAMVSLSIGLQLYFLKGKDRTAAR